MTSRFLVTITELFRSFTWSTRHDEGSLRDVAGSEDLLRCVLSNKPSITPSDAEDLQLQVFRQIGKGQCGTVYSLNGSTEALKIMNTGKKQQLYNDCCMHKRIEEAFQQSAELRMDIKLPRFIDWVSPRSMLFVDEHGAPILQPTYGLLSSRILPLPLPVREAIFDVFAPQSLQEDKTSYLAQPENQDCLVRLYLGRRRERSSTDRFSLRNFDLMVNEMEQLKLDTGIYAVAMAKALAILHWKVKVDADDVEFVLGRSQTSVGIWLLDFNQCRDLPNKMEENAEQYLKQLEQGFYFNDPYYPRPTSEHPKDIALWNMFRSSYLQASTSLITSELPRRFIKAVEEEGHKRRAGASLFQ